MSQIDIRGSLAPPASRSISRRSALHFHKALPYLFLLPGMLLFAVFIVWPMLHSLRISFHQWNIVHPEQSVNIGLQNYADTLTDPVFQRSVINTLAYVLVTVPGQIILRLLVALLLNQQFPGRPLFRTLH